MSPRLYPAHPPLLFFVPLLPYLIATLMARRETGSFNMPVLLVGLLTVWAGQLVTRYFNEYYDQETDALNQHRTPYSGGSGALQGGLLHPRTALWCGARCAPCRGRVIWSQPTTCATCVGVQPLYWLLV